MDASLIERDRRWEMVRQSMRTQDLDVIVAFGDFDSIRADQRYLSGHRSIFEVEIALLFANDDSELIVAHPGVGALSQGLTWIDSEPLMPTAPKLWPEGSTTTHPPSLGGTLANQIGMRGCHKIGIAGYDQFPASWKEAIAEHVPDATFYDFGPSLRKLRLQKSSEEAKLVKAAAHASNEAWAQLRQILHPGRKRYEVMADIEHILRLNGCENSYNLFLRLPMDPSDIDQYPFSQKTIEPGEVYCVEMSPRYRGYYAQQSGMVSFGPMPDELQKVYDTLNRGRDAALAIAKPGVDLADMTEASDKILQDAGLTPVPFFTGHFVGLELEDRRTGEGSILLEENMTLIYHPIAEEYPAVMRADTYKITESGIERLTTGDEGSIQV